MTKITIKKKIFFLRNSRNSTNFINLHYNDQNNNKKKYFFLRNSRNSTNFINLHYNDKNNNQKNIFF
jgi:hypothetical protein